jgi:CheY-like chemotaxis protein
LPLTRKLVGLLGGEIGMRSAVGEGTTFTVTIPARPAEPVADAPDLSGAVLVVDDDETARYVVEAHLRGTAWRVVGADGGVAALAALDASMPVAMILDLSMPDLDGLEVLRRVRADARTAGLPVLVHTSRLLDAAQLGQLNAYGARVLDKSATSRTELLTALSATVRAAHGD